MEDILKYLTQSEDRNDFYLKYKEQLSPISAFIPSRSKAYRKENQLIAIYPKVAGATTKSPMPYVQIENGIIVVEKDMVALKKKPEGPKQYPGTEIDLTEEGDKELLDGFFEFIRSKFPKLNEAIKYGYIQRKTNNALTAKLLKDAISDYIDDLPKSQRKRLSALIKLEAVDISKYIVKMFNERGQDNQDQANQDNQDQANQDDQDQANQEAPTQDDQDQANQEDPNKQNQFNEPYRKALEEYENIIQLKEQGNIIYLDGFALGEITKDDDREEFSITPTGRSAEKFDGVQFSEKISDRTLHAKNPEDAETHKEASKIYYEIQKVSDKFSIEAPYYYDNSKITATEILNQNTPDEKYKFTKEGTNPTTLEPDELLQAVESKQLIQKEESSADAPSPDETKSAVDDAAEAARKAEEEAKNERDRKAAEEAAKEAAEAKRKEEEAEELEKQRKAEEAERKRQEAEAAAKAAEEAASKVIDLPQSEPTTDPEIKEYIAAANKIADRFKQLKRRGDDKIADDIEGFLDIYDSGNPDEKEEAFDLIDPIEEGKAGSVLDSIKSTIRKKKTPIPSNVYDNIKKQYEKLRAKLKELSKTAKNEKENFINHARAFLRYYKIINDFPKFVENTLKAKKKVPPRSDNQQKRAAENIERLLLPLVREVVRRKWQKRIT